MHAVWALPHGPLEGGGPAHPHRTPPPPPEGSIRRRGGGSEGGAWRGSPARTPLSGTPVTMSQNPEPGGLQLVRCGPATQLQPRLPQADATKGKGTVGCCWDRIEGASLHRRCAHCWTDPRANGLPVEALKMVSLGGLLSMPVHFQ